MEEDWTSETRRILNTHPICELFTVTIEVTGLEEEYYVLETRPNILLIFI